MFRQQVVILRGLIKSQRNARSSHQVIWLRVNRITWCGDLVFHCNEPVEDDIETYVGVFTVRYVCILCSAFVGRQRSWQDARCIIWSLVTSVERFRYTNLPSFCCCCCAWNFSTVWALAISAVAVCRQVIRLVGLGKIPKEAWELPYIERYSKTCS
jgi:hypothetical protein